VPQTSVQTDGNNF